MNLKKILAGAVAAGMLWCNCAVSAAALPQKQSPMRDITTAELVKDMGIGINLLGFMKIRVMNMLPGLVVAVILVRLFF